MSSNNTAAGHTATKKVGDVGMKSNVLRHYVKMYGGVASHIRNSRMRLMKAIAAVTNWLVFNTTRQTRRQEISCDHRQPH